MKHLILMAVLGASLVGCAGDPVQLQHNHTYLVEWIGERPLIDSSHLTVTFDEGGRAYGSEIGRASCRERVCQYV